MRCANIRARSTEQCDWASSNVAHGFIRIVAAAVAPISRFMVVIYTGSFNSQLLLFGKKAIQKLFECALRIKWLLGELQA